VRTPGDITVLLRAWNAGDAGALDELVSRVYSELHAMAQRYLGRERNGHTLQATALVNEAYIKMVKASDVGWNDRVHFFAVAARQMRRILVDHARARNHQKRSGGAEHLNLNEAVVGGEERSREMVALDDALNALAGFDVRKARVVELRFFAGLSVEETAAVLNVSADTVTRDWNVARAWLAREMQKTGGADSVRG
jgi:RNA polymerase sigma-70 factor, ECF subfamily